ncbi:hypothetical protein [Chryseobacterium defluvii]|uniref:Phage terminase large subunit-like protein n=1 Tax=Chryseobacterium defluvii TaxID=160396 RepID=A0A495SLH2_9FLAO|nr:hypothetical protein [Chryseobacterium defluvii]RKT01088.1 hypothetical protein BCF58_0302 [Chryseobacterium defluvii]
MSNTAAQQKAMLKFSEWRADWNKFAFEVLGAHLDPEQKKIIESVQFNPRTSVMSGTSRGKDFVSAVAAMCFMYLTPKWKNGQLIHNTKVALTAPTGRQVENIMQPEISRLYNNALSKGIQLPGRLVGNDIRTDWDEWFLTGFKADDNVTEAWTGFHAVNTMFVVTEATGISEATFNAIEGNLQGNSRMLIVFNPNVSTGYAANSQKKGRWEKFSLNSLNAMNVVEKKMIIPGQVDYLWIKDKLNEWCTIISANDVITEEDDFEFEGVWYRPNDLCRAKILGKFPKVSEDALIPQQWVELANKRWIEYQKQANKDYKKKNNLMLGSDIAGMGRDNTVDCFRFGNYVEKFAIKHSAGKANHMEEAGKIANVLRSDAKATASIDTIGEGAGVYSRLVELGFEERVISCKYSSKPEFGGYELKDSTEQYSFLNMRAYLFWQVREWLDPKNRHDAMLPPSETFMEEATEIKYFFQSNGKIQIEKKEDIKKRLKRSTDEFDALANTFHPFEPPVNPGALEGILW